MWDTVPTILNTLDALAISHGHIFQIVQCHDSNTIMTSLKENLSPNILSRLTL